MGGGKKGAGEEGQQERKGGRDKGGREEKEARGREEGISGWDGRNESERLTFGLEGELAQCSATARFRSSLV